MATTTRPTICSLSDCDNSIPINLKSKRPALYCSAACRQKAYRRRNAPIRDDRSPEERNAKNVMSFDGLMKVVRNMNMELRRKLQQELDKQLGPLHPTTVVVPKDLQVLTVDELQEQGDDVAYYRHRKGVVHLGNPDFSRTLCFRLTEKMTQSDSLPRDAKVCQRCQLEGYKQWVEKTGGRWK